MVQKWRFEKIFDFHKFFPSLLLGAGILADLFVKVTDCTSCPEQHGIVCHSLQGSMKKKHTDETNRDPLKFEHCFGFVVPLDMPCLHLFPDPFARIQFSPRNIVVTLKVLHIQGCQGQKLAASHNGLGFFFLHATTTKISKKCTVVIPACQLWLGVVVHVFEHWPKFAWTSKEVVYHSFCRVSNFPCLLTRLQQNENDFK